MNENLNLKFNTLCRNCLCSEGIPTVMFIMNEDINNYMTLTEFDCIKKVEVWRKEKGFKCLFCTSSNIEIFDLEVNGYPLFNINRIIENAKRNFNLDLVVFSIKKDNNHITHSIEGKDTHSLTFLIKTFELLVKYIESLGNDYFVKHSDAHFYSCISEKRISLIPIIDRFFCYGFSQNEIIDILNKILKTFYDTRYPESPKLNFHIIEEREFDKIFNEIFSNIGKKILMNITYFDEDENTIIDIVNCINNNQPKFKNITIKGIITLDSYGRTIQSEDSKRIFIGFNRVFKSPFILGTLIEDQILVSELKYEIL